MLFIEHAMIGSSACGSLRRILSVLAFGGVGAWWAIARLHLVCAQAPADLDGILERAEAAVEQGHLDEALKACQEVLVKEPKSAHALYLLGVIDHERGSDEEAKQALTRSVEVDPSRISTHIALGKVYLSLREWMPAAEQFQAANKLGDPTGSGHFGLGVALLRESRFSEALPHLNAAVRINPEEPEWLFTLVGAELQIKQVSDARKHITQLEKLSPDDASLIIRLGKLLAEHKMPKDAEDQFDRATALLEKASDRPQSDLILADLDLQVARVRYDQHDYEGALERLKRIESSPFAPRTEAQVLHLEGASLVAQGHLDAGREKLRQAADDDPSSPDHFFDWTWAELMAGNFQTAVAAAKTAMRRWPNVPDIRMLQAITQRESTPERARLPFLADWHLTGKGMVCCPCEVPCPCRSNAPPTHGHCESAGAYRLTDGHYRDVPLKGLTFISFHACMGPDNSPSVLYVEPMVSDDKVIALERIFQSLNPLRPFVFLSVQRTAISWVESEEGRTYEASVPGAVKLRIRRLLDNKGKPLLQTGALDRFSNTIEYARNLTYKIWDDGGQLKWDFSGRQANFRTIDLDAGDYRARTMLIQFSDGSGYFNDQQMELIQRLKLPTLRNYPRPAN